MLNHAPVETTQSKRIRHGCSTWTHFPIVAALSCLLLTAGCAKKQDTVRAGAVQAEVPVTVGRVAQKTVPVQLRAIGNVEAYSTVSIKPQVSGPLLQVHFREGDFVRKGQLLFTIDPRPFQVALQQAEANLERDRARAKDARIQAARMAKLFQEGVASSQQNDQAIADADALDATLRADEAAIAQAKLSLEYCTIFSPIEGRTGYLMVHPGNLVKANDVPVLVVINQVNPIYANFALPEQHLDDVRRYMARGALKVDATIPDQPGQPERGVVTFVDNNVDHSTGTIHLKATFANAQRRLWPGQFVNVTLTLAEQRDALVVPAPAIQTGQSGTFVFVVKPDHTAESRPVTVGRTVGGETIIEKGLQPGEIVVTDGQLRLVPGAKVTIKNALASGAAEDLR